MARCGTLMRHVIFARPIATCPSCMVVAAAAGHLITATGFALRLSACLLSASFGAINMAAITMAADQHLDSTAPAQEQPRRRSIGLVLAITACVHSGRRGPWTQSLSGGMMPLHSCSCTVKGTASMRTASLGLVSCLLPIAVRCYRASRWPGRCGASEDRKNSHLPQALSMTARRATAGPLQDFECIQILRLS